MKTSRHIVKTVIFSFFLCLLGGICAAEQLVHVLQKGETLYTLGRKYNVPVERIVEVNSIKDPSRLKVGQKLVIPQETFYEVKKGDTLYSIARTNSVSVNELLQANNMTKDSVLKAGTKLLIPVLPATAVTSVVSPAADTTVASVVSATVAEPQKPTIEQIPLKDPRNYTAKKLDNSKIWPVKGSDISYLNGKLYGVFISATRGDLVTSIAAGNVMSASPMRGFGNVVFVYADNGYIYVYGGLDVVAVKPGDRVPFGGRVGSLGVDSIAGKPQVYLMVYKNNKPVDPALAPRG